MKQTLSPPERGWEVSLDAGRDGERVMFSSVKSGEVAAGCDLKMARGYPSRIRRALLAGKLSYEAVKDAARYVLSLLLHFDP